MTGATGTATNAWRSKCLICSDFSRALDSSPTAKLRVDARRGCDKLLHRTRAVAEPRCSHVVGTGVVVERFHDSSHTSYEGMVHTMVHSLRSPDLWCSRYRSFSSEECGTWQRRI